MSGDDASIHADVIAAYEQIAEAYAAALGGELDHKPFDRTYIDAFARDALPGKPVLDLGCGPGQVAGYLAAAGCSVFGIDASLAMIHVARALHPGVDFYAMDFHALAFANGAFGGLVARYSLVHLERTLLPGFITQLIRVLAPGAPLLVSLFEGDGESAGAAGDGGDLGARLPLTLYRREEVEAVLSQARLDRIRVETRAPYGFETPLPRIYASALVSCGHSDRASALTDAIPGK